MLVMRGAVAVVTMVPGRSFFCLCGLSAGVENAAAETANEPNCK